MPITMAISSRAAEDSMLELAPDMLGCKDCVLVETQTELPSEVHGAQLALINGSATLQVGFFSHEAGLLSLARSLLQMEQEEEDPAKEDIADAVGEIVNMLAGAIKDRFGSVAGETQMGLPVFFRGEMCAARNVEAMTLKLKVDDVPVAITLVLGDSSAGSAG